MRRSARGGGGGKRESPRRRAGGFPERLWASLPESRSVGWAQAARRRAPGRALKVGNMRRLLPVFQLVFQEELPLQVFFQLLRAVVRLALFALAVLFFRPGVRRAAGLRLVVRLALVLKDALVRRAVRVVRLAVRLACFLAVLVLRAFFRAEFFRVVFLRAEVLLDLVQDLVLRVGLRLVEAECLRALLVLPHFLLLRVVLENFLVERRVERVLVLIARGS
jgi:hypothetical protein